MQLTNSRLILIICLVGILGGITACSSGKPLMNARTGYCYITASYAYDPAYVPQADIKAVLRADTNLTNRYATHELVTANAIGALTLLGELVVLEKSPDAAMPQKIINKRQQIFDRILLASTQVAGIAAELACEAEEADRLANYLDAYNARRVKRLTIYSVIIGAVTTIGTTLLPSGNTFKVVGVGGGILGAGVGATAAFSSDRVVRLDHPRNLLADIWNRSPQSPIYPPLVWYALNENLLSRDGRQPIGSQIRQRWQNVVLNGVSSVGEGLYFGPGGNYGPDDLHTRAAMLNDLQSSVRSINQDLHNLTLALVRGR